MATPWTELATRLTSYTDSILLSPEASPAPEDLRALAQSLATNTETTTALVEPFDGGVLVQALFLADYDDIHLVALIGPRGVLAAVTTPDQGEADALYAGLATELGLLNASCQSCSAPVSSVYDYCRGCA